jgi:hypothetical protein
LVKWAFGLLKVPEEFRENNGAGFVIVLDITCSDLFGGFGLHKSLGGVLLKPYYWALGG